MTLKSQVERFYNTMAALLNISIEKAQARWDRAYVVTLLNLGMETVAAMSKGLRGLYKAKLWADQEIYELSSMVNDIVRVDRVLVYKNGDIVADMIPEPPEALEVLDGTETSTTPRRCSVKVQKHDDATAIYELRLSPPANWTEENALVLVCSVKPTEVTNDATEFDCPDSFGHAGFWQACHQATLDPRCESACHKALQRFYAAGFAAEVKDFTGPASHVDPRSYAATR